VMMVMMVVFELRVFVGHLDKGEFVVVEGVMLVVVLLMLVIAFIVLG
jgi:hypothetical protein